MPVTCMTFSNLTLGYNRQVALQQLSGVVEKGSLIAVVGGNGSGKSTLMKNIAGLLKPIHGTCSIEPGFRVAYLPQQSEIDRTFPANVFDLVSLGLWPRRGLFARHLRKDRKQVGEALEAVGLSGFEKRPIEALSGGQMQRALFARLLVQDADLILLDEPFNAVDERTVEDLIALIKKWHSESRTILLVAHDLDLVREHFPEVLILAGHAVAWGKTHQTLTTENLRRARQLRKIFDDETPFCDAAENYSNHSIGAVCTERADYVR